MDQQSQRSSQQLDQRNFISAFLLLFGGILIATIILICENAYSRFVTPSKQIENERKNRQDYKPMITANNNHNVSHTLHETILEKRIKILQERIHQLEIKKLSKPPSPRLDDGNRTNKNKSAFLVLPITYTPEQERSPTLEIVSYSPIDDSNKQFLLAQRLDSRVYETIV